MYALYQIPNKLYTQKIIVQILRKNNIKCKKDILRLWRKNYDCFAARYFCHFMPALTISREKLRWITLNFFFLSGLITATWAARIPDVQKSMGVNDAQWGLMLFAMPAGLVTGLPISN